jgi:FkbM family methyltransferase
LQRLKNLNKIPNGFIDVGAHFGETNELMHRIFPDKRVVSFEANPNCEQILKQQGIEYIIGLLGNRTTEKVPFFLNPDDRSSTGCSIYREKTHHFQNAETIDIPMYRLDEIIPATAQLDFLKMDVQGAEIDVLNGSTGILPMIKWVYLEVSFVSYNDGAPLFDDVYRWLSARKYRLIDICDSAYLDNQLIQTNMLFEKA